MDAHKFWMLRDFIGTNKVLFRIPVYQRNYDWSESNCNRLLDDIYGIMQSGDKHFLGTIVFMAAKSGGFALQEYIIIDGQQRLTTLMLILKALSVVAERVGDDCYHEIEEQYLLFFNGRNRHKKHTQFLSVDVRLIYCVSFNSDTVIFGICAVHNSIQVFSTEGSSYSDKVSCIYCWSFPSIY